MDLKTIKETGTWTSNKFEGHLFDLKLCQGISEVFKEYGIETFWDIGCGPGTYVEFLIEQGFSGLGIDGNPTCESDICFLHDLAYPIKLDKRQASICLEVGEHIPPKYEQQFINNLKSSFSSLLILSWAPPGQEGIGHFNCKSKSDVIKLFSEYQYNGPLTDQLASNCDHWYLSKNLMVFNSL